MRAQRRTDEQRVQRRRKAKYKQTPLTERLLGRLKHDHLGCSCGLCRNKYERKKESTAQLLKENAQ